MCLQRNKPRTVLEITPTAIRKAEAQLCTVKDDLVDLVVTGCPLQYPREAWQFKAAMTDSAKFATYCFSQRGLDAVYASIDECVETALRGKIYRKESAWNKK